MQTELPTTPQVAEAVSEVYSRPEFRPQEPGLREWIVERLVRAVNWFFSLFDRFQGLEATAPVLFWLIVGFLVASLVALIAHIVWTALNAGRDPRAKRKRAQVQEEAAAAAPGGAAAWEAEARRLAAAGAWREAAVALYQAVVLRLDARNVIRADPTKTPGDYRREARRDPAAHRALSGFLRLFEPVAFGNRPLDADGWRRLTDAAAEGEARG